MNKITINSKITVRVTPNLKIKDYTNKDSLAPNRLNAHMDWHMEPVKILQGIYEYDARIAEWNTVKTLVKNKILTITHTNIPENEKTLQKPPLNPQKQAAKK